MALLLRAGGGHKIIRCEISLDLGKTWRLAQIRRFAEPNDYGERPTLNCVFLIIFFPW